MFNAHSFRTIRLFLVVSVLTVLMANGCSGENSQASLILYNGNVVTLDETKPSASAIAIIGTKIMAAGNNVEIRNLSGPNTRQINLRGKTVIPGFIEGHAHLLGLGRSLKRLNLRDAKNWNEIVVMVAEAVEERIPGQWIIGRGWHQEKWDEIPQPNVDGLPYNKSIDAVAPDNPVLLTHASGHATLANRTAMEMAGIYNETPDPEGGESVRNEAGIAIGVFRENAELPLDSAYQAYKEGWTENERTDEMIEAIRLASEDCFSKGVTSFHDAGVSFKTVDLYRQLAGDGTLDLRIWAMLSEDNDSLRTKIDSYRIIGEGDDHITVRAIKRVIDGALGSHGAWLLDPYDDMPSSRGLPTIPVDSLAASAELALKHGFQLCTHAIGDRGNRETLNVYESTFGRNPDKTDLRWRIEHAQHLDPADIPRLGQLGVIASMQGVHCTSDGPWVPKRIGNDRARTGAYVWRSLIESGAVLTNGTDAPVENVSPIECFYASVTRRLPDGSRFYPDQRLTREEALRAYTINNAYAAFEEDLKGSLTPGKLADLVVLSQDLLTVNEDQILKTEVLYTIIGGKIVYQSEKIR